MSRRRDRYTNLLSEEVESVHKREKKRLEGHMVLLHVVLECRTEATVSWGALE